jgi:hypothetical protein
VLCSETGMRSRSVFAPLALLLLASWSCQGQDASSPASAGAPGSAGAPVGSAGESGNAGNAASAQLHGSVSVTLAAPTNDNEGHSSLLARFFDGPTPPVLPLEERRSLGDCRLLVPTNPFCSTPCAPDACTADDVCTPYPDPVAVGTLSVTGLGDALSLEAATSLSIYQSPSLPYPPCARGSTVRATAPATGFELEAACIEPLELAGPDPIPVSSGAGVSVTWTPPAEDVGSRIRIGLDLAHHGGKKGEIDCEVPDIGAFEIPESLVTELVALGLAGYPTVNVTRISRGTATSSPNIALMVSASVERAVDTGVESCLDDSSCTSPDICRADRSCGPE